MAAVCTTYVLTRASVRSFGTALADVSILPGTSRRRSDQIPASPTTALTDTTFLGYCCRRNSRVGSQNATGFEDRKMLYRH